LAPGESIRWEKAADPPLRWEYGQPSSGRIGLVSFGILVSLKKKPVESISSPSTAIIGIPV